MVDYTKMLNDIMGYIFEKPYYSKIMKIIENTSCACTYECLHQCKHDNPYDKEDYLLINCKNDTLQFLKGYFTIHIIDKSEYLKIVTCNIIKSWVPDHREMPSSEYFMLTHEIIEYIGDYEKCISNELKRISFLCQ